MAFSPGLGVIPLLWAILTLLGILFCYFYSVAVGHVYPFVPSISSTGTKRPEGDIFAETMNVSSSVCLVVMAIRYFQINHRAGTFSGSLHRFNLFSISSGVVSVFGITLVANFPSEEDDTISGVHDFGAVLSFVAGSCYCASQTLMTFKLYRREIDDHFSWIYRLILTSIMSLAGLLFLVSSLFAYHEFQESHSVNDILKWEPGDGGYHLHVFSNVCEWVGASSFLLFIVSYFKEFQEVRVVTECLPRNQDPTLRSPLWTSNEHEEFQNSS